MALTDDGHAFESFCLNLINYTNKTFTGLIWNYFLFVYVVAALHSIGGMVNIVAQEDSIAVNG